MSLFFCRRSRQGPNAPQRTALKARQRRVNKHDKFASEFASARARHGKRRKTSRARQQEVKKLKNAY